MKKIILILSIGALLAKTSLSIAQTEAMTESGKIVILEKDGTWHEKNIVSATQSTNTDCDKFIVNAFDKVTGKSTRQAKDQIWVSKDGKNGIKIFIFESASDYDPSEKRIVLSITVIGGGACIESTSKMDVLFRDGSRVSFGNDAEYNCNSNFTLYLPKIVSPGGSQVAKMKQKEKLDMLQTKEIETMRVWTSSSYVEQDFPPAKSKMLVNSVSCLMN